MKLIGPKVLLLKVAPVRTICHVNPRKFILCLDESRLLFFYFNHTSVRLCSSVHARFDTSKPFAYYEILGVPRTAKQSEIKQAYFRLAKIYHPDVNQDEFARENFDKITEAYTTLIDLTQRYFYDRHGHTSEELKKKGTPTIFDWTPRYSIYEERQHADTESTELEDWFSAQGHVGKDEKISIRQRFKNAYVELRFGLNYYDFPWDVKSFFVSLALWSVGLYGFYLAIRFFMYNVEIRRPIKTYLKWENDEIYDILWYTGVRKNRPSDQSKGGMYHMPKKTNQSKSEYSHTIYSNTRSRTKSKNLELHRRRQRELKEARERSWTDEQKRLKEKRRRQKNDGFNV